MENYRFTVERQDPHLLIKVWPSEGRMSGNPIYILTIIDLNFTNGLDFFNIPPHIVERCLDVADDMNELPF